MTRIGVFSDSHGDRDALERLLEEMGHVDAACFLGDISSDAMFLREKLEEMPHQPVLYAVRGNNDLASMLPDQLLIELGGLHQLPVPPGHFGCKPRLHRLLHTGDRREGVSGRRSHLQPCLLPG